VSQLIESKEFDFHSGLLSHQQSCDLPRPLKDWEVLV